MQSKAGSGTFRPAPAGDPRWTQAWPADSLESSDSSPLPPSTILSLQSWRLVTAARGASTGPSAAAPAALLDQVSGSTRQAPGCSGRLAWPQLRPQTAQDQAGDQHPLFLLPHSRSGQGRGFQRRDHLRGPSGHLGKLRGACNSATNACGTSGRDPNLQERIGASGSNVNSKHTRTRISWSKTAD